jgi:Mrp family chromosome partitioning ATPase
VASLLRYRVVVVAATVVGALAGYTIADQFPVRYQAEAVLILSDPGGPTVLGGGQTLGSTEREVHLAKQADIMTSRLVLERALELLGSDQSLPEVRDELDVQPAADLASVSITATVADPGSAAALVNAVGTAYQQVTQERVAADAQRALASLERLQSRLQASLDASAPAPDGQLTPRQQQLAGQIADLQQRVQDITTQAELYASGVEYFEQADAPTSPSQPRPKLAAVLGGLLGLLAAGAWAWWTAARHQRAEGRGDPARILEAPMLGEVPRLRAPDTEVSGTLTPLDPAVEDAYHLIVASIEHELAGVGGRSIAVTAARPDDGKTSAVLGIAQAASRENSNVLMIDADARTPHLTERVGQARRSSRNSRKLSTWRHEPDGTRDYSVRLVSTDSGMVLPVEPDALDSSVLVSDRGIDVRDALRSIGESFDLVLIDAPALLASSNALTVAGHADGVVLVVPHRLRLSDLRDARDRLAFVKAPLLGYVYVRPPGLGARLRRASAGSE